MRSTRGGAEGVFFWSHWIKSCPRFHWDAYFRTHFFQFFSVVVYQFAGKDEEAFAGLAAECLESVV